MSAPADPGAVREAAEGQGAIIHLAGLLTSSCTADPVRGAEVNVVGQRVEMRDVVESIRRVVPGARIEIGHGGLGIYSDLAEHDLRRLRDDFLRTDLDSGIAQAIEACRREEAAARM